MKALVTGCAGFIGSHLTEALLSDGVIYGDGRQTRGSDAGRGKRR
jgi:nucleoside-diphosphate-sugar epimerase